MRDTQWHLIKIKIRVEIYVRWGLDLGLAVYTHIPLTRYCKGILKDVIAIDNIAHHGHVVSGTKVNGDELCWYDRYNIYAAKGLLNEPPKSFMLSLTQVLRFYQMYSVHCSSDVIVRKLPQLTCNNM